MVAKARNQKRGEGPDRFKALAEAAFEGIVFSESGRVVEANDQILKMLGYERDEFIGIDVMACVAPESRETVMEAIRNKRDAPYHHLALRKGGTVFPVEVRGRMTEMNGRRVRLTAIQDLSERMDMKRELGSAQAFLKESESRYRQLVESAPNPIATVSADGVLLVVNRAAVEVLGGAPGTVVGKKLHDLFPREEAEAHLELIRETLRARKKTSVHRATPIRGEVRHFEVHISPIEEGPGEATKVFVILVDVTEKISVEEELRRSHEKYRNIVECSQEWIWEVDTVGRATYSNQAVESLLGYSPEELKDCDVFNFISSESQSAARKVFQEALRLKRGWSGLILEWKHKDGTSRWIESNAVPILDAGGSLLGFRGVDHDVTRRRQAEEDQQRLVAILESSTDLVSSASLVGEITYLNAAGRKMSGWGNGEPLGERRIGDFHPPEVLSRIEKEAVPTAIEKGSWRGETILLTRDGREIPVSQLILSHRDQKGDLTHISTVIRDVSERVAAEKALRESERRFRETLENVQLIAVGLDREGRVSFANDFFLALTGWTREEVLGADWFERFVPPPIRAARSEAFRQAMASGFLVPHLEGLLLTRKGECRTVHWNFTSWRDPAGIIAGNIAIGTDITDRNRMETALRRINRLFLSFGPRPRDNIRRLTSLCGELLEADCAFYHHAKIDEPICRWEREEGAVPWEGPGKSLCRDTLKMAGVELRTISNLSDSSYGRENPSLAALGFSTYMGLGVLLQGKPLGTLDVLFKREVVPDEHVRQVAGIIVAAIGVEEDRLQFLRERRRNEAKMLEMVERERQRLGLDLHDGLGQYLTGIGFLAKTLEHVLTKQGNSEKARASEIVNMVGRSIVQARGLARTLFPVELERGGLIPALKDLAVNIRQLYGETCLAEIDETIVIDDNIVAMHLYRIAQEALHNANHHGKASWMRLSLKKAPEESVTLTVEDNGVGCDPEMAEGRGLGLKTMRHRAHQIGASFRFETRKEGGMVMTCALSLRLEPEGLLP